MTPERSIDRLVADALRQAAPASPPDGLVGEVLASARRTRRLPRWAALISERPMGRRPAVLVGSPTARFASVLLSVVLAGVVATLALVAGGWLPRRDATVISPNASFGPTPAVSQGPAPSPTDATASGRLVLYTVERRLQVGEGDCKADSPWELCTEITYWMSKTDGSGARLLFDNRSAPGFLGPWSPDGAGVLVRDWNAFRLMLIDEFGVVQKQVNITDPCPIAGFCSAPGSLSWSPAGTRLAFDWEVEDVSKSGVLTTGVSVLDFATGAVTEVPGLRSTNRSGTCWTSTKCQGQADRPSWSPDGTRLVFGRDTMSNEPGSDWTSAAIYTVGVDGRDLRRITPVGVYAIDASWSPDGSTIVFTAVEMAFVKGQTADEDSVQPAAQDIATIRVDGTGLRRLTNDGLSWDPHWTANGRILFTRADANWIMDADGSAATNLGFDIVTLTDAGCTVCLYPGPTKSVRVGEAFWQPPR